MLGGLVAHPNREIGESCVGLFTSDGGNGEPVIPGLVTRGGGGGGALDIAGRGGGGRSMVSGGTIRCNGLRGVICRGRFRECMDNGRRRRKGRRKGMR